MEWPWEKKMNAPNVSAVDSLIGALDDTDPEVCCRAAAKAGRERNRAAVLPLVKLLYSRDRPGSKQIIAVAARALGEIGDLRAIQHLEEAGFAHVYGGPPTGVDYIYADGRIVSPEEEDVLMDQAIRDAEKKLWAQPGAEPYLATLGRIKMYTLRDLWRSRDVYVDPVIERRPEYPFTMEIAKLFFANFIDCRFAFEGEIRSIIIRGGKAIPPIGATIDRVGETWPRHSYADGEIYPQTLDEISKLGLSAVKHVGKIHFEFGGSARAPYIQVSPEPKWPGPSIVRRYVLDGGAGIRFDDIG